MVRSKKYNVYIAELPLYAPAYLPTYLRALRSTGVGMIKYISKQWRIQNGVLYQTDTYDIWSNST